MRVLVLGADGMLGHELVWQLSMVHDVAATSRRDSALYSGVDARRPDSVVDVLDDFRPDAVVNADRAGQAAPGRQRHVAALEVNALWPHRLAALCRLAGVRLVHVSTDCVFSGERGGYTEDDLSDANDVYGRTKLLGEVQDGSALTLRTSIIGLELASRAAQPDRVVPRAVGCGRRATDERSTPVSRRWSWPGSSGRLLEDFPALHGLWHVASAADQTSTTY